MKYYDSHYARDEWKYISTLRMLHDETQTANYEELIKIRNKLRRLKTHYERLGPRFIDCENEIIAVNELIKVAKNG